jgi:nitrate reductase alpha subunit
MLAEEFKRLYRLRTAIGRLIACLVRHGLRRARYIGEAKVRPQAQWTEAAVNLQRLFALFEGDMRRMNEVLSAVG